MAWDTMSKGAAEGDKFLKEMRMRAMQIASSNAQADQRARIDRERMAQQERMQQERIAADAAEREEARGLRREELGAQREEREAQMVERQRQFDLSRRDKLGQQGVENRRRATLDEWQMRLDEQKMQAEDARLTEIQERVAALQRQNDDAIRQDEEKRRLYEQVPMEALFSALNTKKPDGTSMGCNLPGVNAEIARQLGLKSVDYSGFDENGIFAIKGTDANGKQFVKQYTPEWVQGACEWFYGKDNPFAKQLGDRTKAEQEVATYGRKKAIDQENYEKNKDEANLQSVLRSLSVEVGKGNMTQEEAEQAFAFYQSQAAKGAKGNGEGTPTPAPQKGGMDDAARQAELDALMKRKQELVAQRQGGQRNIPGMPKRQQEQPAPTPAQTQQQQEQPAPRNDEVVSKPTTAEERKAAIAKIAKEYNIDPGRAERALNIATSHYNQDRRKGGKRSYDSFVTEQITWMMNRGQSTRGRTGRR